MRKKLTAIVFTIIIAANLIACGNKNVESASVEETTETDVEDSENVEIFELSTTDDDENTKELIDDVDSTTTKDSKADQKSNDSDGLVTVEEVTTEASAESDKTTEGGAAPETPNDSAGYTYTDISATKYAKSSVNVRDLPNKDGKKLGGLTTNQEVNVTGTCNETGWYRIDYNGSVAYVSNSYLVDEKIETSVEQTPATQTTAESVGTDNSTAGNASSTVPNVNDYATGVWHDMGTYSFCVTEDWKRPNDATGGGFHTKYGLKWCWVNTSNNYLPEVIAIYNTNECSCTEVTHGGTRPLWDEATKSYYFP